MLTNFGIGPLVPSFAAFLVGLAPDDRTTGLVNFTQSGRNKDTELRIDG